ncbi:hypothetical protein ACJJWD_00090 [Comamonas testosteroni]|uniref:hypothetical protein n=1 Tax=Comamonas testosteroni TaxID=285 RepID=UPI00389B14B6
MPLRTPLFIVAITVIFFGVLLLRKEQRSKTVIKVANIGELSTTSLGIVMLIVGAVLAYFCSLNNEMREIEKFSRNQEQQASSNTFPQNVNQLSTGDGSPNMVNGGSVSVQVNKSRNGQ